MLSPSTESAAVHHEPLVKVCISTLAQCVIDLPVNDPDMCTRIHLTVICAIERRHVEHIRAARGILARPDMRPILIVLEAKITTCPETRPVRIHLFKSVLIIDGNLTSIHTVINWCKTIELNIFVYEC